MRSAVGHRQKRESGDFTLKSHPDKAETGKNEASYEGFYCNQIVVALF